MYQGHILKNDQNPIKSVSLFTDISLAFVRELGLCANAGIGSNCNKGL